jgi:hypothetical protein
MERKKTRQKTKTNKPGNQANQGGPKHRQRVNPFTLSMKAPSWFPDGVDVPWNKKQGQFPGEAIGQVGENLRPFKIRFSDKDAASHGENSHQWIFGNRIYEPKGKAAKGLEKKSPLAHMICELAKRVRRYNASLYRLRRLHLWFKGKVPMPPNPAGGDPTANLPDPNSPEFHKCVQRAEKDWVKVTNDLGQFITKATKNKKLVTVDMVEVNGYVVSMRVITPTKRPSSGGLIPLTLGGSSSHVSISSAFSSS